MSCFYCGQQQRELDEFNALEREVANESKLVYAEERGGFERGPGPGTADSFAFDAEESWGDVEGGRFAANGGGYADDYGPPQPQRHWEENPQPHRQARPDDGYEPYQQGPPPSPSQNRRAWDEDVDGIDGSQYDDRGYDRAFNNNQRPPPANHVREMAEDQRHSRPYNSARYGSGYEEEPMPHERRRDAGEQMRQSQRHERGFDQEPYYPPPSPQAGRPPRHQPAPQYQRDLDLRSSQRRRQDMPPPRESEPYAQQGWKGEDTYEDGYGAPASPPPQSRLVARKFPQARRGKHWCCQTHTTENISACLLGRPTTASIERESKRRWRDRQSGNAREARGRFAAVQGGRVP